MESKFRDIYDLILHFKKDCSQGTFVVVAAAERLEVGTGASAARRRTKVQVVPAWVAAVQNYCTVRKDQPVGRMMTGRYLVVRILVVRIPTGAVQLRIEEEGEPVVQHQMRTAMG